MNTPATPTPEADARPVTTKVWQSLSLITKSIIMLLFMIVAASSTSWLLFAPSVERAFEDMVSRRGDAMVGILEWHQEVRLALSLRDRDLAAKVARRVFNGDPNTSYVFFLDGEGRVLGQAVADGSTDTPAISSEAQAAILSNLQPGETRDGSVHRFVKLVERSEKEGLPGGELDFVDSPPTAGAAGKLLGKIVLGLSPEGARRTLRRLTLRLVAGMGVALLLALLPFLRVIQKRLLLLIHFAEQMASGDLTGHLPTGASDEVGRLSTTLVALRDRMGSMVVRLQDAARALTQASGEILSSSSQQGQAASRQAASVTETGATMAELKEIFAQAAERAQSVIDLAKKSEDSTTSGRTAVQESVQAMEQIRDEVSHISVTILGLVERTNQIAVIIDAVNDLAEQSNVLALNAAIEAARAGEHGKGFAVVAREVRSLAKRSKDSTAQVRTILLDIDKASREAIAVIEEGTRKTQAGMELATRAGESIVVLDQAIDASSTAAKQIAASIRQQSAGMEQIWQAMRDVDRAVQDNVTGIHLLESSSKTMKDLSEEMILLTSAYQVLRKGVVSAPEKAGQ